MDRITNLSKYSHQHAVSYSPSADGRKPGLVVELLLGGVLMPGIIEYDTKEDQVTFTVMSKRRQQPIRGKA